MFHPRSTKYPYTEYTDQHYLVVKKNNGLVFDADYPYFDQSFKLKFAKFWTRVLLYILIWPILCFFMMGLKVKGRKKLKYYKETEDGPNKNIKKDSCPELSKFKLKRLIKIWIISVEH